MEPVNNHEGKVVVITGASSGLGANTARLLAKEKAKVVLGAPNKNEIDKVVSEIGQAGGTALGFSTDVTKRSDVEALVNGAIDKFGQLDVLINNAGVMSIAPLSLLKVDEWERQTDINIKGVFYGVAAALPQMQRQKSGHIINMGSVVGLRVFAPGGTVYSATKFAVHAFTEGLRLETRSDNIRCTTIAPGAFDSGLKRGTSDPVSAKLLDEVYKVAIPVESVAKTISYAIAQPDDVEIGMIVIRPTVSVCEYLPVLEPYLSRIRISGVI